MRRDTWLVGAFASLLFLLPAGCSGGGGSEPSVDGGTDAGPEPSFETVEEALDGLGVDTSPTPRVGGDGEALPADYSPLGSRPYGFKLDELLIAGAALDGRDATVNLFDGVPESRNPDGSIDSPFHFDPLELAETDWDSLDNVRIGARSAVAADVDGDGRQELVAVFQRTADEALYAAVQDDEDGGFALSEPVRLADQAFASLSQIELVAADIDADGVLEVVAALTQSDAGDTPSTVTLWVIDPGDDGTPALDDAWTRQITAEQPRGELSAALAAGNLDDDNQEEIALVVNEVFQTTQATAHLYLIDSNASGPGEVEPATIDVEADNRPWRIVIGAGAIGDVDADGRPELLLGGVVTVNHTCDSPPDMVLGAFHLTSQGLAPAGLPGAYLPVSLRCEDVGSVRVRTVFVNAFDADGDGDSEVEVNHLVVDFDAEQEQWSSLGQLAATSFFPGETGAYTLDRTNTDVAVGDVTGDGRDDVICITENGPSVAVWGASTNVDGSVDFGTISTVPVQAGRVEHPVVVPIDVDHDSYALSYSPADSKLVFTEPVVIATLAAAPCYETGQNSDACVTSFGQAESTGNEQDWSVKVSASLIIGLSSGVNVPFVKVEAETEHKISLALSYTHTHSYELERSVTFSTGPLEDTVVFSTVPYDMYTYRILDHPDPEKVGELIAYFVPREPVVLQVERQYYEQHLVEGAPVIGSNVFSHRVGDPHSYPTAQDKDELLSRYGGLETPPQAVGQGDGSVEVGLDVSEQWTNGGALEVGYEFTAKATVATFIAGYSIGVSGSVALTWSTGQSTSYHGTVGNLSADSFADRAYSFGLFTYPRATDGGRQYQVLDYWVQ